MSMHARKHTRTRAGESMIMVIVMLLVFFVLGTSVLTAASTTTAAASARVIERQGYYYARSQLDVLDESLQRGALGKQLLKAVMRDCAANDGACDYSASRPLVMRFRPSYTGAQLSELSAQEDKHDIVITCTGRARAGSTVTAILLREVDMECICTYRGIDTRMHIRYQLSCNVDTTKYNYESGEGEWNSTWTILQVG